MRRIAVGLVIVLLAVVIVSYVPTALRDRALSTHAKKLEEKLFTAGLTGITVRPANRKFVGVIVEGDARSEAEISKIRECVVDYPVQVQMIVSFEGRIIEEVLDR